MLPISSYNYVNNQISIFMELKLTRFFNSLGIALSETMRLYEYRKVHTQKGHNEVLTKKTLELLYKFAKNGGRIFVSGGMPTRVDGRASNEVIKLLFLLSTKAKHHLWGVS